jgi:hypothetical protein
MNSSHLLSIATLCSILLAACAAPAPRAPAAAPAPKPLAETAPAEYIAPCNALPNDAKSVFDCDRKSILAMAGEFRVRFAFDETAALAPGYVPHAPQRSGGTELVEVIADSGETIALQHILVMKMGDDLHVIKHWRQDWHYQPKTVLRFLGNGLFRSEPVAETDARGAWSQVVYEVDDAPRYAGIGRWAHGDGVDAWTSDLTLRPLPRREYSKRKDYQALEAINRHTLTPAGWVHEQDNTKIVIDSDGVRHAVARERGINSYTRISDFDFSAGRDYWEKTKAYWADVRAEWERGFSAQSSFVLSPEPNGEPRIMELFEQAERAGKGEKITRGEIDAVLVRYGLPLPAG